MKKHLKNYTSKMRTKAHPPARVPFIKILWSGVGAFVGIYLISLLADSTFLGVTESFFVVSSFGASAVLIYGAPQAALAQPRNVIFGHLLSAFIGVSISEYSPFPLMMNTALAVALAIMLMHLFVVLHPPGGATALVAVIGGNEVCDMGYLFMLNPILIGAIILLLIALLINNLSNNEKWHYPLYW